MRNLTISATWPGLFRDRTLALLLGGVSVAAIISGPALSQSPEGGVVVNGHARISQNTSQSTITQTSKRAVIDWDGFDVGSNHSVRFDQPGKSSSTLNRVNSVDRSVISGAVSAPGTVIIQNTAGVIFSGSARIDVGGLVATSQIVDTGYFNRTGNLRIGGGEQADALVLNEGSITIGDAGLAALVGREVKNAGAIVAKRGTVALASGTRTTIDLTGDGMVQVAVSGDAPGGQVTNSGSIDVSSGQVILTAGGAAGALDSVINTSGVIRASSSTGSGGKIRLVGRGNGKVVIAGTVDARGKTAGGSVSATGQSVALKRGTSVDASGGISGGSVQIGGNKKGTGPLRRAEHLSLENGTIIRAEGNTGTGGNIVLWADNNTSIDGDISATGGSNSGFIETSAGDNLQVGENAQVSPGPGGTWLLDPRNVRISNTGATASAGENNPPDGPGAYVISARSVSKALSQGSDVTITTDADGITPENSAGDIDVESMVSWRGDASFSLLADGDITLNAKVITRAGEGGFRLNAGGSITNNEPVQVHNGPLDFIADDQITVNNRISGTGEADITLRSGGNLNIDRGVRANKSGNLALRSINGDVNFGKSSTEGIVVSARQGDLDISSDSGSVVIGAGEEPGARGGIFVYSREGDTTVSAASDLIIQGGNNKAQRSRLGLGKGTGSITIEADNVSINGGSAKNSFAKILSGGDLSITSRSTTLSGTPGAGNGSIHVKNGSSLSIDSATQTWDGEVRVGQSNYSDDGGNVFLRGEITSSVIPVFGLAPGNSFTLSDSSSSYTSDVPLLVFTRGTGAIDLGGPVSTSGVVLTSDEMVAIRPGASVTTSGAGNSAIIAAGRNFVNESDTDAVSVSNPDGRWLVYVDTFDGRQGDAPAPREFDLYGRLYKDNPAESITHDGNRMIYGQQPTLTLTADTATKTYGTDTDIGFTPTGLRDGDSLGTALQDGPVTSSEGTPATADVGTYLTEVVANASDQGYLLEFITGTLTVDPAVLNVTADDASRTYGSNNPEFTASYTGFVLGQDESVLSSTPEFSTDADAASNVGDYDITPSGADAGNYTMVFNSGTLTVDPAELTITANDASRTYGGNDPEFTASYSGFVLGQDESVLSSTPEFSTDADAASNVGDYDITPSGADAGNYTMVFNSGTLSVDPAELVIKTDDAVRTAGDNNPDFTATYTGFVLDQDESALDGTLIFATDATADSPTGVYAVTPGGQSSSNYTLTFTDGFLTVAPGNTTAPDATEVAAVIEPLARGVPPLTPGDASFRTTDLDAPPAVSNTFDLTYSLGEIIQLAPQGAPAPAGATPAANGGFVAAAGTSSSDTEGFVPAAGTSTATEPAATDNAGDCAGSVNRGAGIDAECGRQNITESYWSTTFEETN